MPTQSIEYFINADARIPNSFVSYFDVSSTGVSGLSSIPASYGSGLALLNGGLSYGNEKSGLSMTDASVITISGLPAQSDYSIAAHYSISNLNFNTVLSFVDQSTSRSVDFCIAKYGRPYATYIDDAFGAKTIFGNPSNLTGVLVASVIDGSTVQIGAFSASSNSIDYYSMPLANAGLNVSSGIWKIGNSGFSGIIYDVAVIKNGSIEFSAALDAFVSGSVFDISTDTLTGYISGQTGVLEGDIISLSSCSMQITGSSFSFSSGYSGSEYFVSAASMLDYNSERFYSFFNNTGGSMYIPSGQSTSLSSIVCVPQTGSGYFSYDSGYALTYSITNKVMLPGAKYYNLLSNTFSSVALTFDVNSGDILAVGGYTGINYGVMDIRGLPSNLVDNLISFNSAPSGVFYNGIVQNVAPSFSSLSSGGSLIFSPSGDSVISGSNVYSNLAYGDIDYNDNILGEYDYQISYTETGSIYSGQPLSNFNFKPSGLYFLNGILMITGLDYTGSSFLYTITGSGNYIGEAIVAPNYGLEYQSISGDFTSPVVSFSNRFDKSSYDVWLNGVKLTEGYDFFINSASSDNGFGVKVENFTQVIYN